VFILLWSSGVIILFVLMIVDGSAGSRHGFFLAGSSSSYSR